MSDSIGSLLRGAAFTAAMRSVLVTGASGFVGKSLCAALAQAGYTVRAALRKDANFADPAVEKVFVGEIDGATDWGRALGGVDSVVHLAGLAHRSGGNAGTGMRDWHFSINAEGTRRLAESCADSGVGRLIYLSTVKVNGEETVSRPFQPDDFPAPQDAYGESKLLGERAIQSLDARKIHWTIVRAPLVYGPGVRANFLRLMRWVEKGRPLPFGALRNRRSLIYVENLSDLIIAAMRQESSWGRILMAADGEDLSTPDLCSRIASAMGREVRLWHVPPPLLMFLARMTGLSVEVSRLTSSLVVEAESTRVLLQWSPPFSVEQGIGKTVSWYLRTQGASHRHS